MTPEELKNSAIRLWGERGWVAALSSALGVDRTQVWRYLNAKTAVPGPVDAAVRCWIRRFEETGERPPEGGAYSSLHATQAGLSLVKARSVSDKQERPPQGVPQGGRSGPWGALGSGNGATVARSGSKRQAGHGWVVLARILSWAPADGMMDTNPGERGGRLYPGSGAEKVCVNLDEEAFKAKARPEMRLATTLALRTEQRQGEVLTLPWPDCAGRSIRLQ